MYYTRLFTSQIFNSPDKLVSLTSWFFSFSFCLSDFLINEFCVLLIKLLIGVFPNNFCTTDYFFTFLLSLILRLSFSSTISLLGVSGIWYYGNLIGVDSISPNVIKGDCINFPTDGEGIVTIL